MKELIIYGAGGFGREVAAMVQQINQVKPSWNLIGFYDDALAVGSIIDELPLLESPDSNRRHREVLNVVVAIANLVLKVCCSPDTDRIYCPVLLLRA